MNRRVRIRWFSTALVAAVFGYGAVIATGEDFTALVKRLQQEKPEFAKRHQASLAERYDLADRPAQGVTMSRGKPVQEGVRVKLPKDMTWEKLAAMSPDEIKEQAPLAGGLSSRCRIPITRQAAWSSRKFLIDETKKQTGRDLTRFDLDFDLPRSFPARVSGADLSDDAAGSGRRLARASCDARATSTSCSRTSSIRSSSKACGCWSRRFPSSSSTRPTTAAAEGPAAASPASTATPTATPTPPRTWSATSGRKSIAIASTRRRCAA